MTIQAFRIENFMGFEDSGWVKLRPLTLLFGRNNSGKSTLLRALLLLRQSQYSLNSPLIFNTDEGFDFGSYRELVRNHDIPLQMVFGFRCHFDTQTVGGYSPSKSFFEVKAALYHLGVLDSETQENMTDLQVLVELFYGWLPKEKEVRLQRVILRDEQEYIILEATAPQEEEPSGQQGWDIQTDYSWLAELTESEESLWRTIYFRTRRGFLPELAINAAALEDEEEYEKTTYSQITRLIRTLNNTISQFLMGLEYLAPLRAEPQRYYDISKRSIRQLAGNGQELVRHLINHPNALDDVNKWLATSGLNVRMKLDALDKEQTLYKLLFMSPSVSTNQSLQANIREVGFGISQSLPILILTLLAPENSTLLIEQPELHLHPGAQSRLGDLLIYVAVRRNVRLLIETHSENLLIRMRRRVAESSMNIISPDEESYLPHHALGVLFVDREEGASTVEVIEIGAKGEILRKPAAFKGFFSDDLREVALLTKAQLGLTYNED